MNRFERIDDLTAGEIEAAIEAAIETATASGGIDELLEVEDFIERIGGISNARLAIDMLRDIEEAY